MGMDAQVIIDQKLAACWLLYSIATCSHQNLPQTCMLWKFDYMSSNRKWEEKGSRNLRRYYPACMVPKEARLVNSDKDRHIYRPWGFSGNSGRGLNRWLEGAGG